MIMSELYHHGSSISKCSPRPVNFSFNKYNKINISYVNIILQNDIIFEIIMILFNLIEW